MRVPQDVQVVAYDGTYLTDMAGLRLTPYARTSMHLPARPSPA